MNTDFDKLFLENNNIILKRKFPYIPLFLFVTTIVLLAIALGMGVENSAKMPTLMIAFILATIGIIKLFITSKSLIYQPTNEKLTKRELFFELSMKELVSNMVEKEDIDYLLSKDRMNDNLPIKVTLHATASKSIIICRAYHFVPYSYEPITEYKIIKK